MIQNILSWKRLPNHLSFPRLPRAISLRMLSCTWSLGVFQMTRPKMGPRNPPFHMFKCPQAITFYSYWHDTTVALLSLCARLVRKQKWGDTYGASKYSRFSYIMVALVLFILTNHFYVKQLRRTKTHSQKKHRKKGTTTKNKKTTPWPNLRTFRPTPNGPPQPFPNPFNTSNLRCVPCQFFGLTPGWPLDWNLGEFIHKSKEDFLHQKTLLKNIPYIWVFP